MSERPNLKNKMNRRNVLKSAGAGIATFASIPATSVAEELDRDEILQQAIKLHQKTGRRDLYEKYLRNRGFSVASKKQTYMVPKTSGSNGEPSTQYLDRNELEIAIGISKYYNQQKYSFSLDWNWSRQDADDWGEPPRDIVGFYWENSDWNVADASLYTDSNVYFEGFSDTHSSFEFDDSQGDDGSNYYAYIDLTPAGTASPSERQVGGEYTHTYDGVKLQSVSGGFPSGITVTLSNNNKQWDNSYDENGDALLISQADV